MMNDDDDDYDDRIDDNDDCNESQPSEESRSIPITPRPLKKRKLAAESETALISEAASVLAEIKKNSSEQKPSSAKGMDDDEDFVYCRYLAKELGKISDQRTKAMIKMKFQNILFEAQFPVPGINLAPQQPTQSQFWRQNQYDGGQYQDSNSASYSATFSQELMNL